MYVDVGGDRVVLVPEVVAVLDARLVPASEVNREFVARAVAGKRMVGGLTPECRTLVVTQTAVMPSTISAGTLARRMNRLRRGG